MSQPHNPYKFDRRLLEFATDKQREVLEAWLEHKSVRKAAAALGLSGTGNISSIIAVIVRKAARRGYEPSAQLTNVLPEGQVVKGVSRLENDEGELKEQWVKSTREGMDPADVPSIPEPRHITKTAKLFDSEGKVIQHWISEKPEERERENLWIDFARQIATEIPRLIEIPESKAFKRKDLLAVYPIGDHHLGMMAWGMETGDADYDVKISEKRLDDAVQHLIAQAPACGQALVAFMGDFLHYDPPMAVTPKSRNVLDSDSRPAKMVRVGVRMMRNVIDLALLRHGHVHVIVEFGNHDPGSTVFLQEILRCLYEGNPRVTVDCGPGHYHFYEFGLNLIGTTHGDARGVKLEGLPLLMATDVPAAWGRTKYRTVLTGHIHKDKVVDIMGCLVESLRVLAARDAWAHNEGYRTMAEMKMILYHRDHGEVQRCKVRPAMFE